MPASERTVSDLLHAIAGNLQEIVRSEVRLAKTELREEVSKAKSAGALLGLGLLSGAFAVLFLLLAAFVALTRVMPDWTAALVLAAGLAMMAGMMLSAGRRRLRTVNAATKTLNSLEENIPWAGQQIR